MEQDIALNISFQKVLRYLGYKSKRVDKLTSKLINECISEVMDDSQLRYIYRIFNVQIKNGCIIMPKENCIIPGKDIFNHLKDSKKCVLFAATLSSNVDKKLQYYTKLDLSKSVAYDACATTVIEALCDYVQEEIKELVQKEGKLITNRFSPGYGDLLIDFQPILLNLLNAYKEIGLTSNENFVLIPRKSVTAIIGIKENTNLQFSKDCGVCNMFDNCLFRRDGTYCGD